jgi:Flp pilus assembly protein TadG
MSRQEWMMTFRRRLMTSAGAGRQEGQVLVLFAIMIVAVIAGLGLVLDVGQAWGEQRRAQNTADAMAFAGSLELAKRLAGVTPAPTDADVCKAVAAAQSANTLGSAPSCLDPDLPMAKYVDGTGKTVLGVVGAGSIPIGAAGVRSSSSRPVQMFVTGRFIPSSITATAEATAIAGYIDNAGVGSMLPIAIPVNFTFCNGQNNPMSLAGQSWPVNVDTVVPLCKADPTGQATGGNVGWLDWDPPAGGIPDVVASIITPDNPAFRVPSWMYAAQSGNSNNPDLQTALANLIGQTVLVPKFDAICAIEPTGAKIYLSDCPTDKLDKGRGNQWYHLHSLSAFTITGVHTQGNNTAICGGNGATGCLTGRFTGYIFQGTVDPGPGYTSGNPPLPGAVVGVQLIK